MTWLSENWMLVVAIGGVLLYMLRGGGMMGRRVGQQREHHRCRRDERVTGVPRTELSEDSAGREAVPRIGTSRAEAAESSAAQTSPAQTRSGLPGHSHGGHCC